MTEPEKVRLVGDSEYAWAACIFCKNTIKFCDAASWACCPACGAEYEVLPDGESAIPVALPGFYADEE